jgi:DNA repair ATPase RecN
MNDLNVIKNKVESMNKLQQCEVFKIFLINEIDYNENSNGIFINLTNVSKNVLKELKKYITYVESQNSFLNEQEKQKKIYLNNYFKDNVDNEPVEEYKPLYPN